MIFQLFCILVEICRWVQNLTLLTLHFVLPSKKPPNKKQTKNPANPPLPTGWKNSNLLQPRAESEMAFYGAGLKLRQVWHFWSTVLLSISYCIIPSRGQRCNFWYGEEKLLTWHGCAHCLLGSNFRLICSQSGNATYFQTEKCLTDDVGLNVRGMLFVAFYKLKWNLYCISSTTWYSWSWAAPKCSIPQFKEEKKKRSNKDI